MSRPVELPGGMRGWLIFEGDATDDLPTPWRDRSRQVTLVPLLPEEARDVLAEGRAEPALEATDEALMSLVGQGLSTGEIARKSLNSQRSVQRRMARLRRRFGARSNEELAAFAGQMGIGRIGAEERA